MVLSSKPYNNLEKNINVTPRLKTVSSWSALYLMDIKIFSPPSNDENVFFCVDAEQRRETMEDKD